MRRYAMDFTLRFSVPTDNPDPNALTCEQIADALNERVREVRQNGMESLQSEIWPPIIFDHDTGFYIKD